MWTARILPVWLLGVPAGVPLVGLGLASAACAADPPPPPAPAPAPSPVATTPPHREPAGPPPTVRKALFARVGPEGVPAIVRDVRPAHIAGSSALTFRSLPVDFDGHGVSLRPATGQFDVLEMRVLGTSPTMAALLTDHVGKRVRVRRPDGPQGVAPAAEDGVLVGVSNDRALVALGGDVTSVEFERVALVDAPAEPTLDALVHGDTGDVNVELTYSTMLIRGVVGYRLVRALGTTRATLAGYATITNETGMDLTDVALTVAADVPSLRDFSSAQGPSKTPAVADANAIRFGSLMSLPSGRSLSARLFGPSDVALTRRIVVEGPGLPVYAGTEPAEIGNASVRAVIDATSASGGKLSTLGMLSGSTDLLEADPQASDPPRWYGETIARPLPGGVGLRVDLGDERQFETRRRLLGTKGLGRCVSESSWEVTVTNPTEESIPFEDVEPVSGDYVVLESSLPATAKEKDYFGFAFPVEGKATVRLRFRARVTSCVETGRRSYWYAGAGKKPFSKSAAK